LLDPENGYIKDDTIILEVYVKVDAPPQPGWFNSVSASNHGNVCLFFLASSSKVVDDSAPLVDSLEFPTTHLYELESRVLTSSWNVPFGPKESLGRCLHVSALILEL
jgi:hypothetical protein